MKKRIEEYIQAWENQCYFDGIPEEVPNRIEQLNKAPSYKQLCKLILKNDTQFKTLGHTPKKPKEYHILKRIELAERNKPKQLKLL